jgi:hypothetical protein
MTKRANWLPVSPGVVLVLAGLLVLLLLSVSFTRDAVVGWVRGEAFYRGRPTRYWDRTVREWATAPSQPAWPHRLLWLRRGYGNWTYIDRGDADAVPVFLQLLQSQDARVRTTAVEMLGCLCCRQDLIVPALEAALQDDCEEVREAAASTLKALALASEYQPKADATPWTWPGRPPGLQDCIDRHLRDYDVEVRKDPSAWDPLSIVIRTKGDGREVYAWQGHKETVFTRWQDTLFVAHHGPFVTGCSVLALDLKTGERLWKAPLRGVRVTHHSKYRNQVTIETDGKVVTVRGMESYGRYLEFIDCDTGRTVGHKRYDR